MAAAFVVAVTVAIAATSAAAQTRTQQDTDDEPANQELEGKACGAKESKSAVRTDKKSHPMPDAPPDMALVYVVRPTMIGHRVQTKLAVNGQWSGVNRGNTYFYFTLAPGEHFLCSQSENRSVMSLSVEPGKTYFLQQKVRMGFMKIRNQLALLEEAEGRKHVAKAHLSVSEEKR
jgi:hypothetical protein